MPFKHNTLSFVEKANKIHNFKYDYSLVIFKDILTKIEIICNLHGSFTQSPKSHLEGHGCKNCGNLGRSNLGVKEFINRAVKVHGNKYDYSSSIYSCYNCDIDIICPIHGKFNQTVNQHLLGRGCRHCGYIIIGNDKRHTKEHFVEKAKSIHGNKYDYSKFEYINIKTKGEIICSKHGSFWQKPENHTFGKGCKKCAYEELSKINDIGWADKYTGRTGIFYIIKCWGNGEKFYKIGITSTSVKKRYGETLPYKYEIIRTIYSEDLHYISDLEKENMRILSKYHYLPKLPFPGSLSECFSNILGVIGIKNKKQILKELPEEEQENLIKKWDDLDELIGKLINTQKEDNYLH